MRLLGTARDDYRCIMLSVDAVSTTRQVQLLVLEAFVGPRPEGHVAAHLDGIPGKSRVANLRWATRSANVAHKLGHGRAVRGEDHPKAKLTENDVRRLRRRAASGESFESLWRVFGGTERQVVNIVRHRHWKNVK